MSDKTERAASKVRTAERRMVNEERQKAEKNAAIIAQERVEVQANLIINCSHRSNIFCQAENIVRAQDLVEQRKAEQTGDVFAKTRQAAIAADKAADKAAEVLRKRTERKKARVHLLEPAARQAAIAADKAADEAAEVLRKRTDDEAVTQRKKDRV